MAHLIPSNVKTVIRRANNNGREYGYKPEYIMIDVVHGDYVEAGLAEASNEADIPNARRRAIRFWRKIERG